jgi:hypothetical protein
MTAFADYEHHDALGLAALVRQGKVAPLDVLDAAIERVEARNPQLNAVVIRLYDMARNTIAEGLPDGPLTGVPYLMKDLTASIAGVPMTRGSRFFADVPPASTDSASSERASSSSAAPTPASWGSRSRASLSCTGPRGTRGTSRGSRAARAGERRPPSVPEWCPSRTQATASARSGLRPRAAVSSA